MSSAFRDDPKHWLLRAEEARVCAELISDPESKRAMLEIADQYERIAAWPRAGLDPCAAAGASRRPS
jgi:hypothetical protein